MVFICFAVYVLANNTRVEPSIQDSKYGTTRVLFAKQMKTMYYSLNPTRVFNVEITAYKHQNTYIVAG